VEWIHLAKDRDKLRDFENTVMNLRLSKKAGYFLASLSTISSSRKTMLHSIIYF
jgi:hypothetical protein